jgi:6-phosphogluconolactonase
MKLQRFILILAVMFTASIASAFPHGRSKSSGSVFTMSNNPAGNELIAYSLTKSGSLVEGDHIATGGTGSGGGLGNQGALVLSDNAKWLLAINAGDNTVSVFAFNGGAPELVDVANSEGLGPVSVDIQKDLVYVLNAGSDSIAGFFINSKGKLIHLDDSIQALSGSPVGAAQIGISPDLNFVYVSEKGTNLISTYILNDYGVAEAAEFNPSIGLTPFGFAIDRRGRLIVTEAVGGGPAEASLSSYMVGEDGVLDVISPSVGTTQVAACWVTLSKDERYAYTTNTPSNSISSFYVSRNGALTLAQGIAGTPDAGPIDLSINKDGRYLFTLNSGDNTITAFRTQTRGRLSRLGAVSGLPAAANGLVAW